MRLKEKKYLKNLPPPLKKFSAQGAKKVDYGTFGVLFGLNAVDLILIRLALRNRSLYKDLLVKAEYMILIRTTT